MSCLIKKKKKRSSLKKQANIMFMHYYAGVKPKLKQMHKLHLS